MTACLVPVCEAPTLDLGVWAFLCLQHALEAVSGPGPTPTKARVLPDLRGRCWGLGMTCDRPATTVTAHGGYCAVHAPMQPRAAERTPADVLAAEERAGQLAVLAIVGAFPGAKAGEAGPSLWASRVYGETGEPSKVTPAVTYARATPSRAIRVTLDDERVPRNARAMARARGWSHRLSLVEDNGSLVLKSWRGPYLVVARWLDGSFESAWLQHSRSTPMRLGAREAGKLLKLAP